MQYRHEWKHEINYEDLLSIRARLCLAARPDPHAVGGKYLIRSLYFDNLSDQALREKVRPCGRKSGTVGERQALREKGSIRNFYGSFYGADGL